MLVQVRKSAILKSKSCVAIYTFEGMIKKKKISRGRSLYKEQKLGKKI